MSTMKRVALVTGSSKGIGRGIAVRLAGEGYHTVVTYHRDREAGEAVLEEIVTAKGSGCVCQLDVRSEQSVKSLCDQLEHQFGHLDVLVSNAATEIPKNIEQVTLDEWRIVTETKVNGSFLCTKYGLPLLKLGSNANVIYITSYDGVKPVPDYPAYCTGTAAIIAFAKAMALYLPQFGIRVNCVSPGATRTPLWDALGGKDESLWDQFASTNPMGRTSTVTDVANVVMMIINDSGKYLNGNNIYVDGGAHLKQA